MIRVGLRGREGGMVGKGMMIAPSRSDSHVIAATRLKFAEIVSFSHSKIALKMLFEAGSVYRVTHHLES